jgi:hypothetical protein
VEHEVSAVPAGLTEWLESNRRLADHAITEHIGRVNKIKDRVDEALDAMRVHNGMTLDEFLASQ